ncbi:MAG: TRAP transporter small permease [Clostridiales Family XIII bacterium]|jgi:TRAP-type C4-dicarboxylate transport system permease small subunit|nr:TRAP transporter small permease [Clostridiales Family XIII bacterium]
MIHKALDKVSAAFGKVAAVVLVIVGLFTLANILLRTIFDAPVSGAVEVVQVGMLVANALVLGRAGILDRHIAVAQLVDWFPKRLGSAFRTVTNLLGLATFGYVTWYYFLQIPEMKATGRVTDVLQIPVYFIYIIMAVCFLLATIIFAYWTVVHVVRIFRPLPDEPKPGSGQESGAGQKQEAGEDVIDARDMLT